ncbi:MAG: GDSL-type esterase/lipase family protein [Luteolibacter sp.]
MMKNIVNYASCLIAPLILSTLVKADAMKPIDPSTYEEPVKVACVGDSITEGAGAPKGESYPSQLQRMLGDSWEVLNFGVGGRTLMKTGDRPYWDEDAYKEALRSKADVVIVMLGTNDSRPANWEHKSEFEADYRELVASFQKLKNEPRIYICRPCPVPGGVSKIAGINEAAVAEQRVIIDELAKEMGVGVIDMFGALEKFPKFQPDKVHPNAKGAGKLAEAAFTALTGKKVPAE